MAIMHQQIPKEWKEREKLRDKGQFWTPDWVAEAMISYVKKNARLIFDPGTGTGAFFRALKKLDKTNPDKIFIFVDSVGECDTGKVGKLGSVVSFFVLGETPDEVIEVMGDLRAVDCDIFTIGQYLQPTKNHLPVERYVHPDEFKMLETKGMELGFRHVESGPLVRSSYHAADQV